MGHVGKEPDRSAAAIEYRLPWGAVVRGQRWGSVPDRILLIHEPGTDLDHWGTLPARLTQELLIGVAAFDLPGHGLSDDPWEPARLGHVVRALAQQADLPFPQVLVTGGLTANAALDVLPELRHVALVCLSAQSLIDTPVHGRSPEAPKLFFAGSLAGMEVQDARSLAAVAGGWSNVTSVPVQETGSGLLRSQWNDQVQEGIVSFARDFLGPRQQHRDD